MTTKDWKVVAATAAVACAVTLGLLWPGQLNATDEAQPTPEVKLPTLTVDGCTLAMNVTETQIKPGTQPTVEIIAHNPSDEEKTVRANLFLEGMGMDSMMSRMPMPPSSYWQCPVELVLKAGEKKTISITAEAKNLNALSVNFRLAAVQEPTEALKAVAGGNANEVKPAVERNEQAVRAVFAQRFGPRPGVTSASISFLQLQVQNGDSNTPAVVNAANQVVQSDLQQVQVEQLTEAQLVQVAQAETVEVVVAEPTPEPGG
jgi:hypothetical protein